MVDLAAWLGDLGLERYVSVFAANDVDFETLGLLGDADLEKLGLSLGHRRKLLRALAEGDRSVAAARPLPGGSREAATPTPTAPRPAEAGQRRHLTVMFCDLVGSTQLSSRLDPEDLQRIVREYHAAVAAAVAPYDGHVAQLLGDGVLVYFGYPRAHEDDAGRAVHAALNVVTVVADLGVRGGIELRTRIGIATGLVVVGEIGAGTPAAELTASGETPNLAARLQARAQPGEIVLSDETRRLVGGAFDLESTGPLELKGFAVPITAWRVKGERSVASRFEAQHEDELSAFIGRDSEIALLLDRWALARGGEGQAVLLSGEAGIGKSRIAQTLRERLSGEPHATVVLQCSPYFSGSALYPLVQYFERVARFTPTDSSEDRASKLERLRGPDIAMPEASFGYLLRMMGLPDGGRIPQGERAPQQEKALMLQAPIDLLRGLTEHIPVLMLIEDAHWIDPTTEEVIGLAIEQLRESRLLTLITCRPEYTAPWGNLPHLTRLTLNRLGQKQCVALVGAVTSGQPLPDAVLAEIVRKTDGIPLFVEELTKTVLQSGLLVLTPAGYRLTGPLPALAIPSTLQDSLMARLDRLAPAKEVAQVGAVIGREFPRQLLRAVLQMPDDRLDAALDELVRSELAFRRGVDDAAVYTFKHALIRDTAYNSMLRSQRVLRHAQIAQAIERTETDGAATQPALLAYHHQEGGNAAAALKYWTSAGDLAARQSGNREAAMHYRAALALLPELAQVEQRPEVELALQMKLGDALTQTEGYGSAETARSYARSCELASSLDHLDTYVTACGGVASTLSAQGRFSDVLRMNQRLTPSDLPRLTPMSRVALAAGSGIARLHLGELALAWQHLGEARRALESVEPSQRRPFGGVDPQMLILSYSARCRFMQGFLEQAYALTLEAFDAARREGHAAAFAWTNLMVGVMSLLKGDAQDTVVRAQQTLEVADRMGFKLWSAMATFGLGRGLLASGQADEGIRNLHAGYSLWTTTGGKFHCTEYAAVAADDLLLAGRVGEAREFVGLGEAVQSEIEERYYEAELQRLRGCLSALDGDVGDAEARYRRAIQIAERQGARLFALRAATDLGRLLARRGKAADGVAALRPIYETFSEGFDYPDLARARAVLDTAP